MLTRTLLFASAAAVTLVSGCRDAQVSSYRVPREEPSARRPASASNPEALMPGLRWTAPEGWAEQPGGGMRVASFLIAAPDGRRADMAVTQFPGDVGGDLANVNRWRGQVQLPPIEAGDLDKHVSTLALPSGSFFLTDMVSSEPLIEGKHKARIVGAWLKQPERTWFFKLTGEDAWVQDQREAFETFLRSVQFESPPARAHAAHDHDHDHDHAPGDGHVHELTWSAPASWTAKPPSPMRKGSFAINGAEGEGDLSIISFPGEAGGIVENLNRWRGQLELEPLPAADMAKSATTLAQGAFRFTVVDYTGTQNGVPTRLLGAVLPFENETYFFKLTGPDALVAREKPAFVEFLKTVKIR